MQIAIKLVASDGLWIYSPENLQHCDLFTISRLLPFCVHKITYRLLPIVILSFKESAPNGRLATARWAQQEHGPANLKDFAELRNLETESGIRLIA